MVARDTSTRDLFELVPKAPPAREGALGCGIELRGVLARVIKHCPLSRYEIVARMSELLGTDITKTQLDAWTAESRDGWRFPLEYAAAFEQVTGTYELVEFLAQQRGCTVLRGDEALLAELGRIDRQEAELKARKKALQTMVRKHTR